MKTREEEKWHNLLGQSAPTFAGETEPPYGFVTGMLGRFRAAERQREEAERIGWRALLASLVTLAAVVTLTVGLQLHDRNEIDPGVRSIIEIQNAPIA